LRTYRVQLVYPMVPVVLTLRVDKHYKEQIIAVILVQGQVRRVRAQAGTPRTDRLIVVHFVQGKD